MRWFSSALLSLAVFWPTLSTADYEQYTYTHPDDNYHLTHTSVSDDGQVMAAIGSPSSTDGDELVVFNIDQSAPVWTYDDIVDDRIFDLDVSGDGTTIVACGSGVWLFDVASEELIWAFDDDYRVWDSCDVSADGETIVAGNRQSSVASWDRSTSEIVRYWTFTDGGFVDLVDMTEDGSLVIAASDYSYGLIDLAADDFVWERLTEVEVYDVGFNADGSRGYALLDDGQMGTDVYVLRGLNMDTGKLTWQKRFRSANTPRLQMSADGERIMLTTNKKYYGLNKSGKVDWTFTPHGQETSMQMSENGKFVTVAEGLYYVYFFDWDYPKQKHRAYQIDQPTFPDAVGVSADGSVVAYANEHYVVQQVQPGILVDNQDTIPVYSSGDDIALRYFVSNPGQETNLKIRTSLSLPQVSVLSDLGAEVDGDPRTTRSKLLDYANATLPGYEVIDTRSVAVEAHSSETITPALTVPDLVIPDWLGDLLDLLGLDDLFASLMGDYADPLTDLVNKKVDNALTDGAEDAVAGGQATYAMLGLGQVELYDADTNEVYSTDTFFFMYLVL